MALVSAPAIFRPPPPQNEPVRSYAPGSPERASLQVRLEQMKAEQLEIPCVIGGKDVTTGNLKQAVMPHDKDHVLAEVHQGGAKEVEAAIDAAGEAWHDWHRLPWEERAAVFLRAAELLAGPWRDTLNAATMLGQSKTAHQAEIDAACELIDFWRFNPWFMTRIYEEQPISSPGIWNPASTAMLSAYYTMRIFQEAGLPDGVINLVYGPGKEIGDAALASPDLAGVHFTGSTAVFQGIWRDIGANIAQYRSYPRIVGETGGKGFIVAHPTADADSVATAILRGSFEYQGQKCSAASGVFAPESMWPELQERLVERVRTIKVGDVSDFSNFMGAVIDASAFATQKEAIEEAKADAKSEVVVGGGYDDTEGYFVEPTVIRTSDPDFRLLRDELFGPVVTTFVYPDGKWEETLELVDRSAPYALTGAIFADDREAVTEASDVLRYAAGNLYVNDKPTGAVVAQQPFGGARASGTNDKAGSMWNLIRWVSPRTIKETFVPPTDYRYPFMSPDDGRGAI